MSEGVFLWAYLVVRILLTSIGRHNSEASLYKKLEVLPKDLSLLYEWLLGSLEISDRRLSNLMLSIALNNSRMSPGESPLSALAFSWSFEGIAERYEQAKRQINSLTKGLLEVGPARDITTLAKPELVLSQRVHFFPHRTVQAYLSTSDLFVDDLVDWKGKYARLRTAEISALSKTILDSLEWPTDHARVFHWVESVFNIYRHGIEGSGLPTTQVVRQLENAFQSRTLEFSWYWVYDYRLPAYLPFFGEGISFIHFAAFRGHADYVLAEIGDDTDILDTSQSLNILLYSACGCNPSFELISSLFSKGFSPSSSVQLYRRLSNIEKVTYELRSTWMLFVGQLVDYCFKYDREHIFSMEERCRILLAFLEQGADHEIVILVSTNDECAHFCTLEEIVLAYKPANARELEAWFNAKRRELPESIGEGVMPPWLPDGQDVSWSKAKDLPKNSDGNDDKDELERNIPVHTKREHLDINTRFCFRLF
ncbi:hypothetical protein EG329_008774 [Mollisiaceae sp. DMI_Dod_QoI]|nr:hypothetical protein EG329_008774 [Helotiales sp. DMI_Dod_QoI]